MAGGFSEKAANVKSGSGSKSGMQDSKSEGIGKGKVAKVEKQHDATFDFAQGGDTPMFGEQAAGTQKGAAGTGSATHGGTAHDVKGGAPGPTFASGGKGKMFDYAPSAPATAGITSAR
jgi:hypothetical protein